MIYQVNRILSQRHAISKLFRHVHNDASPAKVLYPLENRKLLKVSGNEAAVFLQGLITNDMRHFEEGAKSMYAMFLNNKGRVLYDTLIHKWENEESFIIECDKTILGQLQRHLKIYKLKRPIAIEDINGLFKLWALISPVDTVPETTINPHINIYKDPRLTDLGFRVLSAISLQGSEIAQAVDKDILSKNNDQEYKYLRYKLGVSEGAEDLPPGTSFPLEANCDYLHGVSFHKGCYIGQELTARVHHTGVVRKRIMPLKFINEVNDHIEKDSVISAPDKPKSNLGKLKGYVRDYGLGLIRIKEALDAKTLNIGKHSAEAVKPAWWPVEAPKQNLSTVKTE